MKQKPYDPFSQHIPWTDLIDGPTIFVIILLVCATASSIHLISSDTGATIVTWAFLIGIFNMIFGSLIIKTITFLVSVITASRVKPVGLYTKSKRNSTISRRVIRFLRKMW